MQPIEAFSVTMFRSTAPRTLLALLMVCAALSGCKHHAKGLPFGAQPDEAAAVQKLVASPLLSALRWSNYVEYQPQVQALYAGHNSEPVWIADGKPTASAKQLIELMTDAAEKGLDPADYDGPRWPARLQKLEAIRTAKDTSDEAQRTVAEFDVALTVCAVRYFSDLHLGRVNPETLNFDIDVPAKRAAFDVVKMLNEQVIGGSNLAAVAASVEPQNPRFKATEAALPDYIERAKIQDMHPLAPLPALPPKSKPVATGGTYSDMQGLLDHLAADWQGSLSLDATHGYTDSFADVVKQFQQRHGLDPDGKLGQGTIDALNVTLDQRVRQLDNTLERFRWLPDPYDQPRIFVNLPEFMLRAYTPDHNLAFKMAVVDGEAHGFHDTPMFVREMRYVVFRPYWNLPPSIIKKEIVPHVRKSGMAYLEKGGYEVTTANGTVVTDATPADIAHLRYAIRQKPGPKNSLGLVKFLFPNEYDVYMHSTPELFLFNLSRRDKSHGCVRLQHADQMAQWVLGNDQKDPSTQTLWDMDSIHKAMNDEDKNNKTINLKTTLPVVITYMTAMADEDGSVHFFNDIYGYDKDLNAALAKGRPYPQGPAKINPTLVAGETE
jgi:murein L,D-transpeptidase YcbB/YkuD